MPQEFISKTLLREYSLSFKNFFLKFIYRKPPKKWAEGRKGDVVLLPGFMGSWVNFRKLAQSLHKYGYKIHVIVPYHSLETVKNLANILGKFLEKKQLKDFYLLAHSKGGIVAKFFLDTNPAMAKKVKKCITISSPWQGTIFAKVNIANTDELKPGSKLLKNLQEKKNTGKILNLYGEFDNLIVPNKNLELPGAKNIQLPVSGHVNILNHPLTLETILENIEP